MPLDLEPAPGLTAIDLSTGLPHVIQEIVDGVVLLRDEDGFSLKVELNLFRKSFSIEGTF